jgi:hypothetical protein
MRRMTQPSSSREAVAEMEIGAAVLALLDFASSSPASDLSGIIDSAGAILGADTARLLVADYSLYSLRYLDSDGDDGEQALPLMRGSLAGLAFSRGEVIVSGDRVFVPIS